MNGSPNDTPGRRIETLSWLDFEQLLKPDSVLLLPLGARCKEHGHHLPLNNDWVMAEYFTERVLQRTPVLAIPTLQYSFYPAFVEYPGSITLSADTSRGMILDIVRSFSRHGLRKFYVLNTGISTLRILRQAKDILDQEDLEFEFSSFHDAIGPLEDELREQEGGTHADELETSMMLYMAPEIVRMDLAQKDYHTEKQPGPLRRQPNPERGPYSPTGAWGDPTLATLEKGRRLVEAKVDYLVEQIEALRAR